MVNLVFCTDFAFRSVGSFLLHLLKVLLQWMSYGSYLFGSDLPCLKVINWLGKTEKKVFFL